MTVNELAIIYSEITKRPISTLSVNEFIELYRASDIGNGIAYYDENNISINSSRRDCSDDVVNNSNDYENKHKDNDLNHSSTPLDSNCKNISNKVDKVDKDDDAKRELNTSISQKPYSALAMLKSVRG